LKIGRVCVPDELAALDALTRLGVVRFSKVGVRNFYRCDGSDFETQVVLDAIGEGRFAP
jgi:hypothetical protein